MGKVFDITKLEWEPVRPDVANGVSGKTLLAGDTKIILTRVAVGGNFNTHRDSYSHLFYFLGGEGLVLVENKQYKVVPGMTVQVNAGEQHSYENTGKQDLMLISVNLATAKV